LDRPSRPYQEPAESSAHLAMTQPGLPVSAGDPCPYQHISALPPSPNTVPQMPVITMSDSTAHALFTRRRYSPTTGVTALADSGASHVLLQASAAYVLHQVEYSQANDPPFAVLKAANHGVLTAIGRGTLMVSNLAVMAYVFHDRDLAHNLLGLVPFANLGCTLAFKPKAFHMFRENDPQPILSGTRDSPTSLWRVPLASEPWLEPDGIPPPQLEAGLYVEANAIGIQDNATYVRFVHACLGYPSPTTFLRAVTAGFITGPD
jgi:hypothetical protein